jgi:hypothetical protein
MAQYLMSVLDDKSNSGTPEEMKAVQAFNEGLQADGHWVFAGGLAAPSTATVVDGRDGEALVTDGPYLESKEFLAGFWVIEAPSPEVALELAKQASKHCNRRLELRAMLNPPPAPGDSEGAA